MSKNKKIGLGLIVLVLLAAGAYRYFHKASLYGATTLDCASNTTCLPSMKLTGNPDGAALATVGTSDFNGNVSVTGTVSSTGTTTVQNLVVTTSNTATSTTQVGCIQTVATSTATAIRIVYSTIATSSPTYTGSNTIGLVGWQYGTCPK